MDQYGWDKYGEEGLKELLRLISARYFVGKDALLDILSCYLSAYTNKQAHEIKGTFFYPKLDASQAQKNASGTIKRLRGELRAFYKTAEGKESSYQIYFIADSRDYRLGVRPMASLAEGHTRGETISYTQHQHYITPHRPYIINTVIMLFFLIAPVLATFSVIVLYAERSHQSGAAFIFGIICLIFSVLIGYIGMVLNIMRNSKLANLYAKYFLRITSQDVTLVSFSATCSVPECSGRVYLSREFETGVGYIAKCLASPDVHRYSIDPITLKGTKLEH